MYNSVQHIVKVDQEARVALRALDILPDSVSRTLFVVNDANKLVGSLTDGDIRRGLLSGLEISYSIGSFMNTSFKYLKESGDNIASIKEYRKADIYLLPLVDEYFHLLEVLDLKKSRTILPVSALIMAGGKGERLKPLTNVQPKPMLLVGDKPILEHNIDRLRAYGIKEFFISVKYLKNQIMDYFGDGSSKDINIHYLEEEEPLGTLGALALIEHIDHEDLLVMNSDILTNIDFEDLYQFYKSESADMAVASIPYRVTIPYAVLETLNNEVVAFSEKPTYNYYSNGGIYLMKFALRQLLEKGIPFNATDMMDKLISYDNQKLVHYPLLNYWLDIGKHQDYVKAQEDIKHISMS